MEKQKTIFIILSQGFLIANILRAGGFKLFKKKNYKMIIFLQCRRIPDYVRKEFSGPDIKLVRMPQPRVYEKRVHRILIKLMNYSLLNKSSIRYFRYSYHHTNTPRAISALHLALLVFVSASLRYIKFLRSSVRWIEENIFPERDEDVEKQFDSHKPDMVFSTSITSKMDILFLKAAKRRNIKTVSMPKTWDTLSRIYLRYVPDYFLVQNAILKNELIKHQDINSDNIYIIGFLEFDWYKKENLARTRKKHLKKMGLRDDLPVIFFGSQGKWFDRDFDIAKIIYNWVKNDELARPCQLLVRPHPHFMNLDENPFIYFKNKKRVVYDSSFHISDDFYGEWDPRESEITDFVNTIIHSDILIIVLSSLVLDGALLDKPVINALFGAVYKDGKDITSYMPSTVHYGWVFETRGTSEAMSKEELKSAINAYLKDPNIKSRERQKLREKMFSGSRGYASERMVEAIDDIINKL